MRGHGRALPEYLFGILAVARESSQTTLVTIADPPLDSRARQCYHPPIGFFTKDELMFFDTKGIRLAYDDQGTGLPLVFLHAFPLNRSMWTPQTTALSRQFRTIAMDLRGHGESDAPLWNFSLDQYADDVCALLDHLAIPQAVLVGLSMGGYISLAFSRKYGSRLKGLVLADTRAQADSPEGRTGAFQSGTDCLWERGRRRGGHHALQTTGRNVTATKT
jgi:pimeloyl-ACP methyl ester carboxylesterase